MNEHDAQTLRPMCYQRSLFEQSFKKRDYLKGYFNRTMFALIVIGCNRLAQIIIQI